MSALIVRRIREADEKTASKAVAKRRELYGRVATTAISHPAWEANEPVVYTGLDIN